MYRRILILSCFALVLGGCASSGKSDPQPTPFPTLYGGTYKGATTLPDTTPVSLTFVVPSFATTNPSTLTAKAIIGPDTRSLTFSPTLSGNANLLNGVVSLSGTYKDGKNTIPVKLSGTLSTTPSSMLEIAVGTQKTALPLTR